MPGSTSTHGRLRKAVFGSGQKTQPVHLTRQQLRRLPNVVEVLADDMRVDDLKYAPNLRNLVARNAIAMQNAFSSYPLSCPARASFFSGMLPHNHHVYSVSAPYGYRAFNDRSTLATSLHRADYTTGLTGKYLNQYGGDVALAPKVAWQRRTAGRHHRGAPPRVMSQYYVPDGWDSWRAAIQGPWCRPACGGTYHYFKYAYTRNGRPTATRLGAYSSNVIGNQSIQMERRFHRTRARTGKPFFLSVNYVAPHSGVNDLRRFSPDNNAGGETTTDSPLSMPAAPASAYRNRLISGIRHGSGVLRDGTTEPGVGDKPGRWATYPELTPAMDQAVADDTRARAAAVSVMDQNIGRLIHRLKASGEWRRTIFIFWSDNGYFQGEHHRPSGKVFAYEPVVRVPMLITGPGMRGGTHTGMYGGQDRFAGIVDPRNFIGFRTGQWLYVRYDDGEAELYNLWADPEEWNNLASDPAWMQRHAGFVATLNHVWNAVKNCSGPACYAPLPAGLRVSSQQNDAHTSAFWAAMASHYND